MKPGRAPAQQPIVTATDWKKMTREERLAFFRIPDVHPDEVRLQDLLRVTRALAREETLREVRSRMEQVAQGCDEGTDQGSAETLRRFARVHL